MAAAAGATSRSSAPTFQLWEEIRTPNLRSKKSRRMQTKLRPLQFSTKLRNDLSDNPTLLTTDNQEIRCQCQARLRKKALVIHIDRMLAPLTAPTTFISIVWKITTIPAGLVPEDCFPATWLRKRWLWFWRQLKRWSIRLNGSARKPNRVNQFTNTHLRAMLKMIG